MLSGERGSRQRASFRVEASLPGHHGRSKHPSLCSGQGCGEGSGIRAGEVCGLLSLDAGDRTIDDAGKLRSEIGRAILTQAVFGFFDWKPSGIAIWFLGLAEACDLAKVSADDQIFFRFSAPVGVLPANILDEGSFFYATVDSSFFERLQGSGLGMG